MKTENGKSGYWGSDGGRCTVQLSVGYKEDDGSGVKFLAGRQHYVPMDIFSFVAQDIDNFKIDCFGHKSYYLPRFYKIPQDAEKRREIFRLLMDNSLHGRHSFCTFGIVSAGEFVDEICKFRSRMGVHRKVEKFFITITFDNGDSLHLVSYIGDFSGFRESENWLKLLVPELRFMEAESGNG